ncbi:MAG: DUF4386 domain-containing protein [bacterium]
MTNNDNNISLKKTARIAGFLYLLLAPTAFFGLKYIPSLTIPGDSVTTVKNIMNNTLLFQLSILCALITPLLTLFVSQYLYKIFKSINKDQATLMVIFTLIATPIAMLSEISHFAVLQLLNNSYYVNNMGVDQIHPQIMLFLDLGRYGGYIAAIFWGFWLLPLGYLILKSNYIPKFIGILMIVAGFGYIIDSLIVFFSQNLNTTISSYTFIGEVVLLLWLLIKGVNVPTSNMNRT